MGDSSAILVDAIRQNPDNSTLRINYAVVLEGRFGPSAARDELHIAAERDPENQFIRRNLALIALKSLKDPLMARNDLNVFFNGVQNPEVRTISLMIDVNKDRLMQEASSSLPAIREELFISYKKYHLMTGNPLYLFAAIETATSVDELEGVRGLIQNLYDDPSTPEETKTKAGELLTIINQRKQSEFGESY
jgi:hypothetical protein